MSMNTLTNEQITAGAAVLCDHGQPIGRNAAIEVFDAMQGAPQNGKREGFEAAAKALQERAAGHFRNKNYALQDECLQCASMLHDLKPAAPSPQVADIAELAQQLRAAANRPTMPGREPGSVLVHASLLRIAADAIAASRRAAGGEAALPVEPTDALLVACGWEEWRPGNYVDRGAATARYNAIRAAAIATPAPASAGQAGQVACSHVWNDFGQLGGRNVSWCPRCDTLAWTGKEPAEGAGQAGQMREYIGKLRGTLDAISKRYDTADEMRAAAQEAYDLNAPTEGAGQAGQVAMDEPIYQVKQTLGASIWCDVSKAEFDSAAQWPSVRRVVYAAPTESAAAPAEPEGGPQ